MVVKFLAPAAVTALMLSATVGPAQAVAQQAAVASDSSFIQMAGSLALLQVRLGKLAEEKGSSPVVKDFGKRMQADYAKASEELQPGPNSRLTLHSSCCDSTSRSSSDSSGRAGLPSTKSTWPRC